MSFSINTNVTSLQAQTNLRSSSDFQSKTINRVTSGLRIVNSGDDAAGLAIANGFRSDQSVLTQGIRNANDGLSTLQTIDGGMNNISMLLDRARTLATQAASGTFAGSRDVLNSEFQNVMTEIDRQSTAIGMNTGGEFAKNLSVFIGGGKDAGGVASKVIANGSVGVDLSKSTVDTQSLGMKGFTAGYQVAAGAQDSGRYDLAGSNTNTTVAAIKAANATATTFDVSGAGFSDAAKVTLTVNMSNVTDTTSLVTAINNSIQSASATSNSAFKAANLVAQMHTGSDGHQQLEFTSSTTSFQVNATTTLSNALMGNITGSTTGDNAGTSGVGLATNLVAASFVAGGTQQVSAVYSGLDKANADTQTITFSALDSSGVPKTASVSLTGVGSVGATQTAAEAATAINAALQATDDSALKSIVAVADAASGSITFANASASKFTVSFGATTGTALPGATGFDADKNSIQGSANVGTGGSADISNQASAAAAVSALSAAVSSLGSAQANVGKAQNQFNYAMNLAQSQSTNLAAAESRIRDADLASEAANLTKAQILIQAGTAALAQANSAPQAILSLLK